MPPLVHELAPPPEVPDALRAFADDGPILFDSAARPVRLGRYSYLTADTVPIHVPASGDPFAAARVMLGDWPTGDIPADLPPFRGGVVGLLGYELGGRFERLPDPKCGPPWDALGRPPDAVLRRADWVLAWDHAVGRAWVIVRDGFGDPAARVAWVRDRFASPPTVPVSAKKPAVPPGVPVPGVPVSGLSRETPVHSPFTRETYEAAVARVVEYVRAGDIFQANLTQPLTAAVPDSPLDFYLRLRSRNPAPFAGFFPLGNGWTVAGASPERFLSVTPTAGTPEVEARPIKGTRRRVAAPEVDLLVGEELRTSAKDRAENVMIVDLLRNDLSRVCEPHSVRVPELCRLETFRTVHHLTSEVRGTLRPGRDAWDLLAAAFPGGSITGAPKVRAMEVIHELEPTARGPYCGTMFWIGPDGATDSNILIRTATVHEPTGLAVFPAGGGVTARSDPGAEYEETLHKAAGVVRAVMP